MNLVVVKLIDVVTRAIFTVAVTYLLTIEQAGQFGIINTLIGLFAFAFGWERHIDIQRRLVGSTHSDFDRAVRSMLPLWGTNYLLMLPLFLILVGIWTFAEPWLLLAIGLIAISEQISNSAYNLAVVDPRYSRLIVVVALKNCLLVITVATAFAFASAHVVLPEILTLWAIVSLSGTAVLAALWQSMRQDAELEPTGYTPPALRDQYKASAHHFLIGALAVVSLQFDRLAVGAILPLADVGAYFRHVVLVAIAYQFFNVASYNRRLPEIFETSRDRGVTAAIAIIRKEYLLVAPLALTSLLVAAMLDWTCDHYFTDRFDLSLGLAAMLLIGALFRIAADFLALVLNARMAEAKLFRNQLTSFILGAVALALLTRIFGLYGAASAVILTMVFYLILNQYSVRRLPAELAG
jgi:O-antigen/teichoic acid export membrane protein